MSESSVPPANRAPKGSAAAPAGGPASDSGGAPDLANLRTVLRREKHADEEQAIETLLAAPPFDQSERKDIVAVAHRVVARSRELSEERGTLDAFLQEFGLSNKEGVALMCLAEALLRIPDDDTRNDLIAEKMLSGDWAGHKGRSDSPFVNAGVWALMLTGGVVRLDKEAEADPAKWMKGLVGRLGEPVIREAVMQAMRIMGRQFVYGRTIKEAMARGRKEPEDKQLFSFDMLGEGARTDTAAKRYKELYADAIRAVGGIGDRAAPHELRSSISIKLSALHPRYQEEQRERVLEELAPVLIELAELAKGENIGLTIDAEEADRLDLSLSLFDRLAREEVLNGWQGLGLAAQAYQKRILPLIDWLVTLGRATGRRFPVRLVKGAYWDTEIKHAQVMGYPDYAVWTRKASTDIAYLSAAARMVEAPDAIFPQFATHNAHTLAAIAHLAGRAGIDVEYQRLHGMAGLLIRAAEDVIDAPLRFRTYAPVGAHEDLLPYLVRRLLENGANSSFVNRFMDAKVPVEDIVRDPFTVVSGYRMKRHNHIPRPEAIYGAERKNSAGLDWTDPLTRSELLGALKAAAGETHDGGTLVGGQSAGADTLPVTNPANRADVVGTARLAGAGEIDKALALGAAAQPDWDARGGAARADILEAAADRLEADRAGLISLLMREAGKTIPDAVSEVREAADFCRYYAARARAEFTEPLTLPGPTGESNELSLHGRGVFACIAPWNFPLAIFTGQVAAALAAGNAVAAKPAEQTPLVATRAVKHLLAAGVPAACLALLAGDGATVGAPLVSDPRIAGVAFTGSTETARAINRALAAREAPIAPLIAETGGQNAMIVDSSALTEQVTDDVMVSAFGSAGQRCSALRVLYLQDSIADATIAMLKGALAERKVGDPAVLATDVGPIIDDEALSRLRTHIARMEKEATLIAKGHVPETAKNGTFIAPHIFEIPSLGVLTGEVFGPILHVIRYRPGTLDDVVAEIRATGFGLTFGVHSRLESRWLNLFRAAPVGNAYVNRNMIGAVVGVQPFGGQGLSGTGPKAGGPHYLLRFATEKVLTVNTAAIGGNTELFSLNEGGGG